MQLNDRTAVLYMTSGQSNLTKAASYPMGKSGLPYNTLFFGSPSPQARGTENAGREMEDMKMSDLIATREIAGRENAGYNSRLCRHPNRPNQNKPATDMCFGVAFFKVVPIRITNCSP